CRTRRRRALSLPRASHPQAILSERSRPRQCRIATIERRLIRARQRAATNDANTRSSVTASHRVRFQIEVVSALRRTLWAGLTPLPALTRPATTSCDHFSRAITSAQRSESGFSPALLVEGARAADVL